MKPNYLNDLKLKPGFTLKFPPELEAEFDIFYFIKSLKITRTALLLGIVLYSLFGVLDVLVVPSTKNIMWFIRFAIVVPYIFLIYILSYFSIFKKIMQPALASITIIAGGGIIAMISLSAESAGRYYYYAGLILVIIWSLAFVRLKYIYATISCWILILAYIIISIFHMGMLKSSDTLMIFINNNFFFISATVIGMFAGYQIEFYSRKDFLNQQRLTEKQRQLLSEREELKQNNEKFTSELEMALLLQKYIMPYKSPHNYINFIYKPMETLSGDLFDFIEFHDSEKTGIFISDVSGHGVPSAIVTSMLKTALLDTESNTSEPARLMTHLNKTLCALVDEKYITSFYCIYDPKIRTILYSNAGQINPLVIRNDKIFELDQAKSIPLGIFDNDVHEDMKISYKQVELKLDIGDKILIFTDGLIEAKNPGTNEQFATVMKDVLIRISHLTSKEFLNSLLDELIKFRGIDSFSDDICIICLEVL